MGRPNELGIPTSTSGHVMSDLSMFKMHHPWNSIDPQILVALLMLLESPDVNIDHFNVNLLGLSNQSIASFFCNISIVNEKITNILDES